MQQDFDIIHAPTGRTLFILSMINVCVDKMTRKVVPLPQWWVDKYAPLVQPPTLSLLHLSYKGATPPPQASVHRMTIHALPLEEDFQNHISNKAYTTYCFVSIISAFRNQRLPSYTDEEELISSISVLEAEYIGESVAGDELVAETWQDLYHTNIIWTRLLKQGKDIFVQKATLTVSKGWKMSKV